MGAVKPSRGAKTGGEGGRRGGEGGAGGGAITSVASTCEYQLKGRRWDQAAATHLDVSFVRFEQATAFDKGFGVPIQI